MIDDGVSAVNPTFPGAGIERTAAGTRAISLGRARLASCRRSATAAGRRPGRGDRCAAARTALRRCTRTGCGNGIAGRRCSRHIAGSAAVHACATLRRSTTDIGAATRGVSVARAIHVRRRRWNGDASLAVRRNPHPCVAARHCALLVICGSQLAVHAFRVLVENTDATLAIGVGRVSRERECRAHCQHKQIEAILFQLRNHGLAPA